MKHDIVSEGIGFRLRPLSIEDADFIVNLRTDPVRAATLHPTSPKVEDQVAWTNTYFERPGDWYFVIERLDGNKEGAISIYNFDESLNEAEWGRWITRHKSLCAIESAALIYEVGFEVLGLDCMYTHTENNPAVVSFHTSMGSTHHGTVIGPLSEIWVEQRMTAERWKEIRTTLESKVQTAARLSNR